MLTPAKDEAKRTRECADRIAEKHRRANVKLETMIREMLKQGRIMLPLNQVLTERLRPDARIPERPGQRLWSTMYVSMMPGVKGLVYSSEDERLIKAYENALSYWKALRK